jgi:hypothetical protein
MMEVVRILDSKSHSNPKVLANMLFTIFNMNKASQRTQTTLQNWFLD